MPGNNPGKWLTLNRYFQMPNLHIAYLSVGSNIGDKLENCQKGIQALTVTGHSLGATGVQEAIYCMLMMQGDFIAASANVENLDPAFEGAPLVTSLVDNAGLDTVISNSFGFGGTNCTLALSRYDG